MKYNASQLAVPFGKNTHVVVTRASALYNIKILNEHQWREFGFSEGEIEDDVKEELLKVANSIIDRLTPLYQSASDIFGEEYVGFETQYGQIVSLSKTTVDKNNWVHFSGGHVYLLAHMPEVEITNEYNLSTTARDLCIRVEVNRLTPNHTYRFAHYQGLRYTLSLREAGGGYSHSHLPGVAGFFNHFCLGSSQLAYQMNTDIPKDKLDYVIALMYAMAGTESIAGSPYRRLDDMLNVERSLSRIVSDRRGSSFPNPNPSHVGKILQDAYAAGKQFPLEVKTTGDFGGEVTLIPNAEEEIKALVEQFAPDSLKVSATESVSGITEESVRARLPSVQNVPPKARKIFNGVTYNRVNIEMDQAEKEVLVKDEPKKKEAAKVLPERTKHWLVTNTTEIIKNRLENEPRWTV